MACNRCVACLAPRCRAVHGDLSLAACSRASGCSAFAGGASCRTLPLYVQEGSLHLFLSARQGKYSYRILGWADAVISIGQHRPFNYALVILLLAITLAGFRRLTEARARRGGEVVFEEEYPVDIVSLNLS